MFDGMATYLIFTGQIMGGNGLDMIVISGEGTWIQGTLTNARVYFYAQNRVCTCRSDVVIYCCGPIIPN